MIIHIATDENFDGAILRGLCIKNLAMIIGASDLSEWDNLVIFLPFGA